MYTVFSIYNSVRRSIFVLFLIEIDVGLLGVSKQSFGNVLASPCCCHDAKQMRREHPI